MTNRDEYLNSLDDDELAFMIHSAISGCDDCPIKLSRCCNYDSDETCERSIEKWLREKE